MSTTQSFLYYYFKKLFFTIPLASFVVEQGRIAHLKPIPIVFGMAKPLQKGWQVSQLEYRGGDR
ncbi:hypothetical protein CLV98_110179 [Dyadobacter jejuensis]|uniref:Uncharacterized protein n=1 Tax=Dyadobacter jejuensis TaxID=1082580 RepID=A0A316AHV7_9BACT|nr:hypothetical protein [Dyadobacter jejuensis]PWJ56868.1 hypothetical protein CLV98_110179 [Dyadobacter jejuensis]